MEPTTSPLPFANPFGALVGRPMDDDQPDVAEINLEAFKACQRLVADVSAGGYSAALTVFGDAGTGKTHLIGRVRRWMEQQPANLFVFVRMETSPAGVWRHLRRHLAAALLRANSDGPRALDVLLEHRKNDLEVDRDLAIVLENLLAGRHVRDSASWLRGEGLPEDALKSLQLNNLGPDDDLEVISRHVVLSICNLLRPGVVVFCLDQIEAIMSSAADRDGPHAFARVVACLVDETRNAGIICCEGSSFIITLEQILDNAAKQRVMGRRTPIRPLSLEQAQQLIRARLQGLPEDAAAAFLLRAKDKLKDVFKDNAAPARAIISRCKDLFDQSSNQEPLNLQAMLEDRFRAKDPAETEAILRNGMPLLARSAGVNCMVPGNRSPFDFAINDGKVAVAIINEGNNVALAGHIRKLADNWKPAVNPNLLLLRDTRLPISPSAKKTHERIASIQKQGGRLVTVSQEAVETLAALRRLLSDAESGDLAHHGESVAPRDVENWIAGNRPAALDHLVSEFGSAKSPETDLSAKLASLLADKKMMTLEDAARTLQVAPGEVEECACRDPGQFGLLRGSVPALFQTVTAAAVR